EDAADEAVGGAVRPQEEDEQHATDEQQDGGEQQRAHGGGHGMQRRVAALGAEQALQGVGGDGATVPDAERDAAAHGVPVGGHNAPRQHVPAVGELRQRQLQPAAAVDALQAAVVDA